MSGPDIESVIIRHKTTKLQKNNKGKGGYNTITPEVRIDIPVYTVDDIMASFNSFKDERDLIYDNTIGFPATIFGVKIPYDNYLYFIIYNRTHIKLFDQTNIHYAQFPADIRNILIYPNEVTANWTNANDATSLTGRPRRGGSRMRRTQMRRTQMRRTQKRFSRK